MPKVKYLIYEYAEKPVMDLQISSYQEPDDKKNRYRNRSNKLLQLLILIITNNYYNLIIMVFIP